MTDDAVVYVADFVIFGRRTRRAWKKTYTHAYAALRHPEAREWVTGYIIGFSASRKHAELQVSKRRHQGWTGPFEIVEVTEE